MSEKLLSKVQSSSKQFLSDAKRSQRKGQALMNALYMCDEELYTAITGTDADCFYDDKRIPEFTKAVEEALDDNETIVLDEDVTLVWKCDYCGHREYVLPTFFQENGNPRCQHCNVDEDMNYVETRVRNI